ncbi:MAG: FtsL-like putative cell division protein [Bacteroidaceae bacterium]
MSEMTTNQETMAEEAAGQPQESAQQPAENTGKARLIRAFFDDDEQPSEDLKAPRWSDVLKTLDTAWLRRQLYVVLLIVVGIIIYITNRYQAQQQIIELEQLQNELKDMKFRVLTRSSELTLRTRQSQLEEQLKALGDSTLLPSNEAPFIIEKEVGE